MGVDRVVSVSAKDDGTYKQQTDDRDFHHDTSPYHFEASGISRVFPAGFASW